MDAVGRSARRLAEWAVGAGKPRAHWDSGEARTLACVVGAMSTIDLALTAWGLHLGVISEANPLMAAVLARSPTAFVSAKVVITVAFVALISRFAGRFAWTKWPCIGVLVAYALVMGAHARWLATIW